MRSTIDAYFFGEDLAERGRQYSTEYQAASPYPHIVLDDFLANDVIEALLREFPDPNSNVWRRRTDPTEVKLQSTAEHGMGPATRQLLNQFNSAPFIEFLEQLTGIRGLIPDPHYLGGGMHQIEPGGFLKVHADFNRHDRLRLDRRLNLLLYMNPDWEDEYGGHFEMWATDMSHCEKRVLPVLNRCVIFSTTSTSYHGHPSPLQCPPDRSRRSLALYYYTNGRPDEELRARHTTRFQRRPGEAWQSNGGWLPSKSTIKRFIPPIITDWLADRR